jgi:transcriptional regulator with XRE-family HTH domain
LSIIFTARAKNVNISVVLLELGKLIRAARESRGLNQQELADRLETSRPSISAYENGKTAPPVDLVAKISKILEVDFTVAGFVIGREQSASPKLAIEQLCLEFDTECVFEGAVVKIKPSKETILITASFPSVRTGS